MDVKTASKKAIDERAKGMDGNFLSGNLRLMK